MKAGNIEGLENPSQNDKQVQMSVGCHAMLTWLDRTAAFAFKGSYNNHTVSSKPVPKAPGKSQMCCGDGI